MEIQVCIPLAATHNFIQNHDPNEIFEFERYSIPSQVQLYMTNLELSLPDIQKFYELLPDVIELLKPCGPVTRQ